VSADAELEADDLMWSYSRVEGAAGGRTLICSGDRDLYQAVDDRTSVLELRRDEPPGMIDAAGVRERSGVDPAQIPDLIALRGDPSDGLPGAPGIGAKTAAELLRAHGSLEAVLAAAEAPAAGASAGARDSAVAAVRTASVMRPRIAAALRDNAELLRTFKQIATLQGIAVERPQDRASDFASGSRVAREMGMGRLAERLEKLARA
jgi:DNA polymerase-1